MNECHLFYFYSNRIQLFVCCLREDYDRHFENIINEPVLIGIGDTESSSYDDFLFKKALGDGGDIHSIYN